MVFFEKRSVAYIDIREYRIAEKLHLQQDIVEFANSA